MPGVSVAILFADGTTWIGTSGIADVAAREPVRADTAFAVASVSKTFTAALILALRDEGRLTSIPRSSSTCPSCRSTVGSRSASCSTTRAACATSSSGRIDKALLRDRGRRGTRIGASATSGSPTSSPGRAGTTRTRTTCCSASSPSESAVPRSPTSWGRASSPGLGLGTPSTRSGRCRPARWRTATASLRGGRSRSTSRTGRRSRRSPRSSPRPGRRVDSRRRRSTSFAGFGRCTAASCSSRRHSRR